MAATNRIINYGKGLTLQNQIPEVFTIHATEKYSNPNPLNKNKGEYCGIRYRYASKSLRSNSFLMRRINDFLDLMRTIMDIFIDNETSVNFFYLNSFWKEAILVACSKIKGKKVVRELCEYPYYNDKKKGERTIKYIFPLYDGFIAISEHAVRLIKDNKILKGKVIKVPILIDVEEMESLTPYKHSKPYVFHGGTLTESKDAIISTMTAFVKAKKYLNKDIDFILAGPSSSDKLILEKIIKENNLESNVIFLGQIHPADVRKYQLGADLSILNKNDTNQNRYGFSTKLGDILLSKTAVITTTVGEANNWLEDGKSAYICEPHNPDLIADKIIKAFEDDDIRENIAQKGKEIASANFDYKTQGIRLKDFFENL